MSFLFRSKKQRERDARKERRRAFRQAENAIDDVKERVRRLEKDASREWEAAKVAAQKGEEAAVNRALTSYRGKQVILTQLQRKQWVFEQTLVKLEVSGTDAEFASALELLNKTLEVDPERLAESFEESSEILSEQKDAERLWERMYQKELDGVEGELTERVPEMNTLKSKLLSEATKDGGSDLSERLSEGQRKVRNLLDQEKE
ncbi:MAG: hypothetical protein AB3N63_04920 [Puniceicoccaceae bacterium]